MWCGHDTATEQLSLFAPTDLSNWRNIPSGRIHIGGVTCICSDLGGAQTCGAEFSVAVVRQLRGKDLACWGPLDQPCHADVLLEIANTPIQAVRNSNLVSQSWRQALHTNAFRVSI
ncbi:DUF4326 domain-containing protein [Roseovarius lutimaris]|uniref:DUF4326 domain-containing protein n=1 Tax=Roseovarius lutimaris TaxID=1005928 RepID=UPI000B807973|nr:DUF4326 domain-containing protein [Roseovarius lutimaris]